MFAFESKFEAKEGLTRLEVKMFDYAWSHRYLRVSPTGGCQTVAPSHNDLLSMWATDISTGITIPKALKVLDALSSCGYCYPQSVTLEEVTDYFPQGKVKPMFCMEV